MSVMNKISILDSHLHLQDYEHGTDIGKLLKDASVAGVSHVVCNGTSQASWDEIIEYTRAYPQVIPCFGVHPWFIEECSSDWHSVLEEYLMKVPSGVGEIGLDRLRNYSTEAVQEDAFRAQLDIARRLNRPVMIHCVRAWGWMVDVLRSEPDLPAGLMFHSFGGSTDTVKLLARMGAYFSFSGKVLFTNYGRARDSILSVPQDRLLIETDGPCMLPPEQYRVQTIVTSGGEEHNHPANLPSILGGIADLLNESPEDLQTRIWQNSKRFFGSIADFESMG